MKSQRQGQGGKGQRRRKEESRPVAPQAAPHKHMRLPRTGEAPITDNNSTKGGIRQARREGFHMVSNEAIRQWLPILGPNAWAVLSILNTYANSRDRLAWPSLATLAQYTGLNTTTVRASLVILEATGLIARIPYKEAAQSLSDDRLPQKRGRPPTIWLVRALDGLPAVDRERLEEAIEKARAASNQHIGKYIAAFIQRAQAAIQNLPATVAGNFSATVAPYSELPATVAGNSVGTGEEERTAGGDFPATVAGEQKEDNIRVEVRDRANGGSNNESDRTISILSDKQQQIQGAGARSDSHSSPKAPSAPSVVVHSSLSFSEENSSLLRAWLKNAGVKEPMLSRILREHPDPDVTIGWILYATTQRNLTNPTGFIVKCLRESALPPEDVLPLARALARFSLPELDILACAYAAIAEEIPLKSPRHVHYTTGWEWTAEEILDILHERMGEEKIQRLRSFLGDALERWVDFLFQVESARLRHQALQNVRFPWEKEPDSMPNDNLFGNTNNDPYSDLWEKAQEWLRKAMSRRDFNTWLRDARLLQVEKSDKGTDFVIGLSHAFAKNWVSNRLNDLVVDALAEVMRENRQRIKVRYVVDAGNNPNLSRLP